MYFNVNFNVFFKLIKVHLLMSELYIYGVNVFSVVSKMLHILKLSILYIFKSTYTVYCAN